MKSARILEPRSAWGGSLEKIKPKTPFDILIGKTIDPARIDKALGCEENNNGYVLVYRREGTCPDKYEMLAGQPVLVIGALNRKPIPVSGSPCPHGPQESTGQNSTAGTPISVVVTAKTDLSYKILSIDIGTYATGGPMKGKLICTSRRNADLKPIANALKEYLIARSVRSKGGRASGAASK